MKGFLRKNLGLKLFAGLLAFILWASIVSRAPQSQWFSIPIEFDEGTDRVLVDTEQREVEVRLHGDSVTLDQITPGQLRAVVPVRARPVGKSTVVVVPEEIRQVPRGITEIEVLTSGFQITLDKRQTALLPVAVETINEVPENYRVVGTSAEPTHVEITGPSASLIGVTEVSTEQIDLSEATSTINRRVKLVPLGQKLRAAPSTVRVAVEIEEVAVERSLLLPIVPEEEGWRVEPRQVEVLIQAPPSLFPSLEQELTATVSVEALGGRGGEAIVNLDWGALEIEELPRVRVAEVKPPKVRLLPPQR